MVTDTNDNSGLEQWSIVKTKLQTVSLPLLLTINNLVAQNAVLKQQLHIQDNRAQ